MNRTHAILVLAAGFLVAVPASPTRADHGKPTLSLGNVQDLEVVAARSERAKYRGRDAVHLTAREGHEHDDEFTLAVVPGSDFTDGTIEVDVSGEPQPGLPAGAKGFVGIAFHVQRARDHYEAFYIRPVNARLDDQLMRNHSTQYVSMPDYGWERLRKETPGLYESYTDLEPGVWTHLKVEVAGTKARLYVNRATQPALIVNDLKIAGPGGAIALWSHTTTDAYFANLRAY